MLRWSVRCSRASVQRANTNAHSNQSHAPVAASSLLRSLPTAPSTTPLLRTVHSLQWRLSDQPIMDKEAIKAAHKAKFAKIREQEIAARLAAAGNAAPASDSSSTSSSTSSTDSSSNSTSSQTSSSSDSAADPAPAPTQSQVNSLWSKVRAEVRYFQEHFAAKTNDPTSKKKAKVRPVIKKSIMHIDEWSTDPLAKAKAEALKAAKKASEEEAKEGEEAKPAEYQGSTALQIVDTETVWDKRFGALREKIRFLGGAVMPKKAIRTVTEGTEGAMDSVKESWETSQSPAVWKLRDVYDKVAGETETGMALGEIMQKDPHWNYLDFLREMEETMIPEVITAFRMRDMELLKSCTEGAASQAMFASFLARDTEKIEWDSRILDVRGVDVVKASLHDDVPFIHLSFVCQHVGATYSTDPKHATYNEDPSKREPIDKSKESEIQNTYYSWAIKRDYESPYYDWKIFEFHFQHIQALI